MSKPVFTVERDKLEVISTHVFDASRESLWKAFTDPDLIPKWWGPRNLITIVDKMDVKVGGTWRYTNQEKGGEVYAFNGVYQELVEPEKLVFTFEWEGMPGHISVITATLEDLEDGKTKLTETAKFSIVEDLDGMVNTGMESGQVESLERLAELVENKQ